MENNHLNSSDKFSDSDKDKLIELRPEKWDNDKILVGLWQGENEIGAFVVSKEILKDETLLLDIVNSTLLISGYTTGQWMQ